MKFSALIGILIIVVVSLSASPVFASMPEHMRVDYQDSIYTVSRTNPVVETGKDYVLSWSYLPVFGLFPTGYDGKVIVATLPITSVIDKDGKYDAVYLISDPVLNGIGSSDDCYVDRKSYNGYIYETASNGSDVFSIVFNPLTGDGYIYKVKLDLDTTTSFCRSYISPDYTSTNSFLEVFCYNNTKTGVVELGAYIIYLGKSGIIWEKSVKVTGNGYVDKSESGITVTPDGGIYFLIWYNADGPSELKIVKMDSTGSLVSENHIISSQGDFHVRKIMTSGDNIYLLIYNDSSYSNVVALDGNLNLVWKRVVYASYYSPVSLWMYSMGDGNIGFSNNDNVVEMDSTGSIVKNYTTSQLPFASEYPVITSNGVIFGAKYYFGYYYGSPVGSSTIRDDSYLSIGKAGSPSYLSVSDGLVNLGGVSVNTIESDDVSNVLENLTDVFIKPGIAITGLVTPSTSKTDKNVFTVPTSTPIVFGVSNGFGSYTIYNDTNGKPTPVGVIVTHNSFVLYANSTIQDIKETPRKVIITFSDNALVTINANTSNIKSILKNGTPVCEMNPPSGSSIPTCDSLIQSEGQIVFDPTTVEIDLVSPSIIRAGGSLGGNAISSMDILPILLVLLSFISFIVGRTIRG